MHRCATMQMQDQDDATPWQPHVASPQRHR